jgi:hypothetical protein
LRWRADRVLTSNTDVGKRLNRRGLLGGRRGLSDRVSFDVGNSFSAAEVELVDAPQGENFGSVPSDRWITSTRAFVGFV